MTAAVAKRVLPGDFPENEHPLETGWTVWYDRKSLNKQESDQYIEGLHPLGSFNTVEGFYSNYAYLMRPHELPENINIHVFRKGYKPMWEEFPDGGCWSMRLPQKENNKTKVDSIWESILLALIGEQFEMPDVVGCVLSRRANFDMISVWNMTHTAANCFKVGELTREIVGVRESKTFVLTYKSFMEAMRDFSTYRNAKGYKFGSDGKNNGQKVYPPITPALGAHPDPKYGGAPPKPKIASTKKKTVFKKVEEVKPVEEAPKKKKNKSKKKKPAAGTPPMAKE